MAKIIPFPPASIDYLLTDQQLFEKLVAKHKQLQQQTKDQQQTNDEVQNNINNCLRALELTMQHLVRLDDGGDEDCCLYLLYHYKGETGFINLGFDIDDLADKFGETLQLLGVKVEIEIDDEIDGGG